MIKFLHCADLHLDSPLSALDLKKAEVRRNEFRAAFTSLTLYARMNKIDLLLISGDLFDGSFATKDTMALMVREFANIPDCRVVIAPGNHDPYTSQSYYKRTEFPDNVYIFDSSELSCFDFPEINAAVYGYAFESDTLDYCPFDGFTPENPTRINFLAAHGELGKTASDNCPIPLKAIEGSGFDYVALGHYHTFDGVSQLGSTYYAYSGCLESRGFDELGPKGAIIGAADKTDGRLQLGAKFVRFSKRHYEIDRLDVTGAKTNAEVAERIAARIAEAHYGEDTALRVILTGNTASDLKISSSFLTEQSPKLFILELEDETLPLLDGERLKTDPTIRGAFYTSLAEMLDSADEGERELAALALRYGLSALSGGDIVDF